MNRHITKVKNLKDKLDTLLMNANTSYCHKTTTSRNSRLKVNWFEMDNILISDQAKATDKFTEFGRGILGTQQYTSLRLALQTLKKPVLTDSVAPPSP